MATLSNPWAAKAHTYKGQLHCHSKNSDGANTPTDLITAYKNAGYDFVCLTDHNKVTADPSVAGILFIPGAEETASGGHINAINVSAQTTQSGDQRIINEIIAAGGLAQVNHPNWSSAPWTDAEIKSMVNFKLMEVFNPQVSPNSNAEDKYDACISTPNKRVWCTAVDDCHNIAGAAFNVGWIMVNADECTLSAIMAQIAAGNFYASTGAVISNITLSGSQITVTTPDSASIKWVKKDGTEIKTSTTATSDSYTTTSADGYVRIVITRDSDSKQAWSQPLFWVNSSAADDEYTVLLQHFEGADSGVIIEDATRRQVGVAGDACTKTGQKVFGDSSGYFDGAGDYLDYGAGDDFAFGSGDFTIDFRLRPGSVAKTVAVFGKHDPSVWDGYYMEFVTGGYLNFCATTNGSSWTVNLTSAIALSADTWYHVAIVRDGDAWGMFVDGVLVAGTVVSGNLSTLNNSFYIGRAASSNAIHYANGYIDEFRVSKGIARWPVGFDVPSAEAVYDATYDKLLLLMNGDDNGTTFTDEAGKSVTRNGDTCTKTGVKKFGSASGYFDGAGDYLLLADSEDFEFGAGDFTIDFWVYAASVATNRSIFNKHKFGVYDEYYCYFSSAGVLRFNCTTDSATWNIQLTASATIAINTWYHVAIQRNGNVWSLSINGSPLAVSIVTGTIPTSIRDFWVGRSTAGYLQGYLDDFRVSKGVARFPIGNYAVPIEAYGPPEEPEPPLVIGILFATMI